MTGDSGALESLRRSERAFRVIADTLPMAIFVGTERRYLYVNAAAEVLTGFPRTALLAMNPLDVIAPEYHEDARRIAAARQQGLPTPSTYDAVLITKEGTRLVLRVHAAVGEWDGQPVGIVTAIDITAQQVADDRVAAMEAERRAEHAASPVPTFTWRYQDADFVLAECNEAAQQFTQGHSGALIGARATALYAEDPDIVTNMESVFRQHRAIHRELDYRLRSTGERKVVVADYAYCPPDRILVHVQDITALKETERTLRHNEERLRVAFTAAHMASCEWDLRTGEVVWDGTLLLPAGSEGTDFRGTFEAFLDRVHEEDRGKLRGTLADAIHRAAGFSTEFRIGRREGDIRWVALTGRVVTDAAGVPARLISVSIDVTERHVLQQQFIQAQKMEAVGRLAGGVAHDLNNALTAIAGFSDLALMQLAPTHPSHQDVSEVRAAAERAASVTRQLLGFSRKQPLLLRIIQLNDVVTTAGRLLTRLIGEDIAVRLDLAESLPALEVDPGHIEQAILNLAVNARDAMPDGGQLTIRTALRRVDGAFARTHVPIPPGEYVVLEVADTGHGMDTDTLAHIFEPFYTTKPAGHGTGLGLAMVYGTVKQAEGFVFCDSAIGRGTTFSVYLPPSLDVPDEQPAAPVPAESGGRHGSITVLVVEDEDAVRRLVSSVLRLDGYRVLEAPDGASAVDIVQQQPTVDLLITDVIMPGMNGRALAEGLMAKHPKLLVLFVSGYSSETLVMRGVEQNVGLILKPFTPGDLRMRVAHMLRSFHRL